MNELNDDRLTRAVERLETHQRPRPAIDVIARGAARRQRRRHAGMATAALAVSALAVFGLAQLANPAPSHHLVAAGPGSASAPPGGVDEPVFVAPESPDWTVADVAVDGPARRADFYSSPGADPTVLIRVAVWDTASGVTPPSLPEPSDSVQRADGTVMTVAAVDDGQGGLNAAWTLDATHRVVVYVATAEGSPLPSRTAIELLEQLHPIDSDGWSGLVQRNEPAPLTAESVTVTTPAP